jgi:hypothetical protein
MSRTGAGVAGMAAEYGGSFTYVDAGSHP